MGFPNKSIIPRQEYLRRNEMIGTVSDTNYLAVRGQMFNPDANPTTLQADIQIALEQYLTSAELKDISSTERSHGQAYLTKAWSIGQSLYSQAIMRGMNPAVVGALDAASTNTRNIWLTDDWKHGLAEATRIALPPGMMEVIRLMNPLVSISKPQPALKFRGSHALMWAPHMTYAEFLTALGTLKTYTEAGRYLAKCKVPLKSMSFGEPILYDAADGFHTVYGAWLATQHYLSRRNSANTGVFHMTQNEYMVGTVILDAALLTDVFTATTWPSSAYMYSPCGCDFSDLWALLRYTAPYDAADNPRGASSLIADADFGTTRAGDKFYMFTAAHDATTYTIAGDSDGGNHFTSVVPGIILDWATNQTLTKLMGDARGICPNFGHVTGMEYVAFSNDWINNIETNLLEKVIRDGGIYAGIGDRAIAATRPTGGSEKRSGKGRSKPTGRRNPRKSQGKKGKYSGRRGDNRGEDVE